MRIPHSLLTVLAVCAATGLAAAEPAIPALAAASI